MKETTEYPGTSYVPEIEEASRKARERLVVEEGSALWARRKEELRRQKRRDQLQLRKMLEDYYPWGKPGGGAPCPATLRKKNVRLFSPEPLSSSSSSSFQRKTYGTFEGWSNRSPRINRSNIDPLALTDANKFYDDKSAPGIVPDRYPGPLPGEDPKNRYNEDVQVYRLNGGVELVPLITSNRYQSEPQAIRYLATDATRPGYTLESLRKLRNLSTGNREYVSDLAEQIERKRERVMEERRREEENCRRHYDTWRRLWGRPGHGAPIDHFQRTNLHNLLYRPSEIY